MAERPDLPHVPESHGEAPSDGQSARLGADEGDRFNARGQAGVTFDNACSGTPKAIMAEPSWTEGSVVKEATHEHLQEVKARTMFQMVEELADEHGDVQKLIFLTNAQASLLAKTQGSVKKLLDALEIPQPKLLLNFLSSGGSSYAVAVREAGVLGWEQEGVVPGKVPFLSQEDAALSAQVLDNFMNDVILPLAVETNAVILVGMETNCCVLTESFMRVFRLQRARWGLQVPFTILGMVCSLPGCYLNPDLDATWRTIRRNSVHWRMQDRALLEAFARIGDWGLDVDLEPGVPYMIIVDTLEPKKAKWDPRKSSLLRNEILRHFMAMVPVLTLKTGLSMKVDSGSSLTGAVDALHSGSPTLFLDTRPHPKLDKQPVPSDRAGVIEAMKQEYGAFRDRLLEVGLTDFFDVCALAHLHDALYGDGNSDTTEGMYNSAARLGHQTPLHTALRRAQVGGSASLEEEGVLRRATPQQVQDAVTWLTHRLFADAWQIRPDRDDCEKAGKTFQTEWGTLMQHYSSRAVSLLTESAFHVANVGDLDGCSQLVRSLVKIDRMPPYTCREGLEILVQAWDERDIAVHRAKQNKRTSKAFFLLQLLFGAAMIVCTVHEPAEDPEDPTATWDWLNNALLGLSVGQAFLLSATTFLNPTNRWRQLRSSASSLERMIWRYRTRVGEFTQASQEGPEGTLRTELNQWRENLVAGTDLAATALERKYPASVYKHCQYAGVLRKYDGRDDHHSPVSATMYVELRLLPAKEFYQERLPRYSRKRTAIELLLFLAAALCAVFSYLKNTAAVATVSTVAASVTSWSEFTDLRSKLERYSGAIRQIKMLHLWWVSLGEVEQHMDANINRLVFGGEAIISEEPTGRHSRGQQSKQTEAAG